MWFCVHGYVSVSLHKLCVCESEFGNELNVSIFFVSENCDLFRILKLSKEEVKLNVTYFLKLSKDDLFTIFSKNISGT